MRHCCAEEVRAGFQVRLRASTLLALQLVLRVLMLPLLLPISGNSGEVLPCPAFVGDGESFHPRDDCGENARLVTRGFGAPRIFCNVTLAINLASNCDRFLR